MSLLVPRPLHDAGWVPEAGDDLSLAGSGLHAWCLWLQVALVLEVRNGRETLGRARRG